MGNMCGSALPADVSHRYHLQCGRASLMLFGSDQYGTPIYARALKRRMSPLALARQGHARILEELRALNIIPTKFCKTTCPAHCEFVNATLRRLRSANLTRKTRVFDRFCRDCDLTLTNRLIAGACPNCRHDATEDWCSHCARLIVASELLEPRCAQCGGRDILQNSRNGQALVLSRPEDAKVFVKGFANLKAPWLANLRPFELSRAIPWGVQHEILRNSRVYVWFEALCGYQRLVREFVEIADLGRVCRRYYFGKDNVFHHVIVLQNIMRGAGYGAPDAMYVRQFVLAKNGRMSKKLDTGEFASRLIALGAHSDGLRLYLCSIDPLGGDTTYDRAAFEAFYNGVYCGNLCNLWSRYSGLMDGHAVKQVHFRPSVDFSRLRELHADSRLQDLCAAIVAKAAAANKYISAKALWREESKPLIQELAGQILDLTHYLNPVCPGLSGEILKAHGLATPPLTFAKLAYTPSRPFIYGKIGGR